MHSTQQIAVGTGAIHRERSVPSKASHPLSATSNGERTQGLLQIPFASAGLEPSRREQGRRGAWVPVPAKHCSCYLTLSCSVSSHTPRLSSKPVSATQRTGLSRHPEERAGQRKESSPISPPPSSPAGPAGGWQLRVDLTGGRKNRWVGVGLVSVVDG